MSADTAVIPLSASFRVISFAPYPRMNAPIDVNSGPSSCVL